MTGFGLTGKRNDVSLNDVLLDQGCSGAIRRLSFICLHRVFASEAVSGRWRATAHDRLRCNYLMAGIRTLHADATDIARLG
jgi:hypothetical protein